MKKLYFWSRLNFSKYFIPQKLGKFRQHWSSQKSRSEVDDVKDRVIKWRNFVRYSILYQLWVTYLQFPWQKLCLFFMAFFRNFLNFEKKMFIFFDPTNHIFFCHRVHYEPHLKLHFLTPLLYSLAVLKSTLLPKRPLKAIRTLLFSWRLLLHDTYLRGRRKKEEEE